MNGNEDQVDKQILSAQFQSADNINSLWDEIFRKARPYIVELGKDALVTASIYIVLFIFELIFQLLPLHTKAADIFSYLHMIALFAMLSVFAWLSIVDVLKIHKSEKP